MPPAAPLSLAASYAVFRASSLVCQSAGSLSFIAVSLSRMPLASSSLLSLIAVSSLVIQPVTSVFWASSKPALGGSTFGGSTLGGSTLGGSTFGGSTLGGSTFGGSTF